MGIIGSIFSGILGSNAANHAADTQAGAANNAANLERQNAIDALNFEKQVYGDQQTNQRPFLQAGQGATYSLANLLGIRMPQSTTGTGGVTAGPAPTGNPTPPPLDPSTVTPEPQLAPGLARRLGLNNFDALQTQNGDAGMGLGGVPLPTGSTTSFNTAAPITSPPGNANQLQMRPPITSPGTATGTQGQINPPITSPGAGGPYQIQMRPPITSGGTTGPAAAGMIQIGPNGQPTGVTPEFNPGPETLNFNPQSATNATTNQGGTGQVPQGGLPSGAVVGPDGTVGLGDPSPFGPGGTGDLNGGPGSADDNSFGSLLRGYGKQFAAPTDVTEQNDPGYKFRLQQGNDAIQRSAAARGGLLSGGTAKALTDYAQGSASQEYGNVYNRALSTFDNNYNQFNNDQTNKFNRLASLAGFGQTAAGQLSNAGSNAANNVSSTLLTSGQQIGNDIQNAGAARASGYVGGANAINGAISGGTNSLDSILLSQFL